MADELYRRLRAVGSAGALFAGLLERPKKSGRGGWRPGAGRPKGPPKPPKPPRAPAKRPLNCEHEKPRFANGRERKFCFACYPKPEPAPRKPYTPAEVQIATCGCGVEFIKTLSRQVHCGAECRTRASNNSERHKRTARELDRGGHRRRVRQFGGKYYNFKVSDVLERDGWKCRACGVDTPKDLRGEWVHNAPEIDHVVPISRGGDHSMDNTQCLCRSCNGLKKDRTMAEFLDWLAA